MNNEIDFQAVIKKLDHVRAKDPAAFLGILKKLRVGIEDLNREFEKLTQKK